MKRNIHMFLCMIISQKLDFAKYNFTSFQGGVASPNLCKHFIYNLLAIYLYEVFIYVNVLVTFVVYKTKLHT